MNNLLRKTRRIYLSDRFSDQMTNAISDGKTKITVKKDLNIGILRKYPMMRSCIRNKGLLGTLTKLGIKFSQASDDTIVPLSGDIIFVVYPTNNQHQLWPYKTEDQLPEDIHLSVKRYIIGDLEESE